jgi:hypothetical protein
MIIFLSWTRPSLNSGCLPTFLLIFIFDNDDDEDEEDKEEEEEGLSLSSGGGVISLENTVVILDNYCCV